MADYIVQKAVSLDKVKAARRKVLSQPGYLDSNYLGQRKYDGCSVVLKLGVAGEGDAALSRTGERVQSLEWMLPYLHRILARMVVQHGGIALLAEAWSPDLDFSAISGNYRRHEPWLDPCIKVFDLIPLDDFEAGHCPVTYMTRMSWILEALPDGARCSVGNPGLAELSFVNTHFTPNTAGYQTWQEYCDALVAKGGYDGLILRRPDGTWTRGSGTTGEILKLKRVLSFDLRCVGWEEGRGKHAGRVGALIVEFQGKHLRVGTGLSDQQRQDWWDNPNLIHQQIVEVEAMDFSSDGLLREPRFKGIRFDKLEPDT